jgi:hypothetical protein
MYTVYFEQFHPLSYILNSFLLPFRGFLITASISLLIIDLLNFHVTDFNITILYTIGSILMDHMCLKINPFLLGFIRQWFFRLFLNDPLELHGICCNTTFLPLIFKISIFSLYVCLGKGLSTLFTLSKGKFFAPLIVLYCSFIFHFINFSSDLYYFFSSTNFGIDLLLFF